MQKKQIDWTGPKVAPVVVCGGKWDDACTRLIRYRGENSHHNLSHHNASHVGLWPLPGIFTSFSSVVQPVFTAAILKRGFMRLIRRFMAWHNMRYR